MASIGNDADLDSRIKIKQLVITEGKYDKIKLSSVLDAEIVTTDGFGIYSDSLKKEYIKKYGGEFGVLIVTDSDHAGFQIRNFVKGLVPENMIFHCFIPEIKGKEKRKTSPSAEGTLGVEGMSAERIIKAINDCGVTRQTTEDSGLKASDLYELGLLGAKDSKEKRERLMQKLSLPKNMNNKLLLKALSKRTDRAGLEEMVKE